MNNRQTYAISLIGYYILVIAAIALSTYLTYHGFVRSLPILALPFAIVIGIVLFVVDITIQRWRDAGKSILLPLVIFVFPAAFSGASNFNSVYTAFMQKDVSRAALEGQYTVFRDDLTSTLATLTETPSIKSEATERGELESLLDNLKIQGTDPLRPGCGARCRELIAQINDTLEIPVTDLKAPSGSNQAVFHEFFNNFQQLVYRNKGNEAAASDYIKFTNLKAEVNRKLKKLEDINYDVPIEEARQLLTEMSEFSNEVERRANTLLPGDKQVNHTDIDPEQGRLGEIIYTLENGFVTMPNPSATILALAFALFVDFMPILVAFIVNQRDMRPDEDEEDWDTSI